MVKQKSLTFRPPLVPERVRKTGNQGFSFIPNRFLRDGFFAALKPDELVLYLLLILVGNRQGMSYYYYDSLCQILGWHVERYLSARNALIKKGLIAFDGTQIQVLELPEHVPKSKPMRTQEEIEQNDSATIRAVIQQSFNRNSGGDDGDC